MDVKTNKVAVLKTNSYEKADVSASVKSVFSLLGLYDKIKPSMSVLLKPNLVMKRNPNEATTTHPSVVAAVIDELMAIGVTDIVIADSPGGPYTKSAVSGIYEVCGMNALSKQGAFVNADFSVCSFQNKNAKLVKEFTLINAVKKADYIINLPKIKTHAMMTFSGAVKNLFGTVPGLMKPEFHWRFPDKDDFADMLLDLTDTVAPDVSIIDAVVGMEGDGPTGGTAIKCGAIIAGENPYILDIYSSKLIGLEPSSVPTIKMAAERGIAEVNVTPEILGDSDFLCKPFEMPKSKTIDFSEHIPAFLRPVAYKILTSRPKVRKNSCVGCGKCAESCPAKTITILNKKASINYKNCIHCFCCHEMCPVKAIDLKRLSLFNW